MPGFDPKECLVGFGCFFTILVIQIGLCDVSTQIVARYIALMYPGRAIVQSWKNQSSSMTNLLNYEPVSFGSIKSHIASNFYFFKPLFDLRQF